MFPITAKNRSVPVRCLLPVKGKNASIHPGYSSGPRTPGETVLLISGKDKSGPESGIPAGHFARKRGIKMTRTTTPTSQRGQITSLQALRALAFLGIFLHHVNSPFCWPAIGVSVFFVLSGFLMEYKYFGKEMSLSVRENLRFAIRKISKLYALHIITMCLAVIREVGASLPGGMSAYSLRILLCSIALNVTLLQTWIPRIGIAASLNGVAWFLSVIAFLYFMFPYISRWIRSKKNSTLLLCCVLVLAAQVVLSVFAMLFFGGRNNTYIWFTYYFPVFRLGDFFAGCCLGKYYLQEMAKQPDSTAQKISVKWSVFEILLTIATVFIHKWTSTDISSPFLAAMQNQTTPYILPAVGWVYLFARKKGFLTNLLCNKILIRLGDLSPYMFLVHYFVTTYAEWILSYWDAAFTGVWKLLLFVLQFVLTVILTLLYLKIRDRLRAARDARKTLREAHKP